MSESGRFKIMPNGSEIDQRKKKKFQFSNCQEIDSYQQKEPAQHVARNLQNQVLHVFTNLAKIQDHSRNSIRH